MLRAPQTSRAKARLIWLWRTRGVAIDQILVCVVPEEEEAAQGNDRSGGKQVSTGLVRVRLRYGGTMTVILRCSSTSSDVGPLAKALS